MKLEYLTSQKLDQLISIAIREDVGEGDHSTLAAIPADATNQARLVMKADGVIAGLELARSIFHQLDEGLNVTLFHQDGDQVKQGDVVLKVTGKARSILTAERLVLNFMQRMSGIATYTRSLTDLVAGTGARILDTRKTTPGIRMIEKWAVTIGGGQNHRFGLFDMIMLKDNHIDFAGGISNAIKATHQYLEQTGKSLKIEIETRNLKEVAEVIEAGGVDVILLDNMDIPTLKKAVEMVAGRFKTEASGGITATNLRKIAETGVDFISVGALTHSYKSLDMSLKAD
ncbi:MAG: carboxylating nicotinate-nucleotide diphosphorylase [Candidatus Cyclobacteriaceae bacterium M3_2C_046]